MTPSAAEPRTTQRPRTPSRGRDWEQATPTAETPFALPARPEQPLHILLVEDSVADADLLIAMLEDELHGVIVTVCKTVSEALRLLADAVDIVITDLSLPDAEGLQALSAILTARPDTAVVVMTGRKDHGLALQALSEGAEDYLVKGSHDARAIATAVLFATQRRLANTEAHRYERLARSLLDAMEASTCAVDGDGTIIAVNQAWHGFAEQNGGSRELTGVGMNYFDVCARAQGFDSETGAAVAQGLRQVLDGSMARFERDYACHGPTEERWLSVRVNPLREAGAVLSHIDMTVSKRAEQALAHLTLHDPLTNLPNRQLLEDRLAQALAWAGREDRSIAVAFLDVDEFKRVNDTLGHAAGDELLQVVATRLSRSVRDGDTVARVAGNEFAVVWPGIESASHAQRLAQRLSDSFSEPLSIGADEVAVTASIGVVLGQSPDSPEGLLMNADAAMFDAKRGGRGRLRMYSEDLREDMDGRLRIEAELRAGLEHGEFVLYYQPVIDLQARAVTGVEALVRWEHPLGLRMPDSFIPVAEATGLIVPLGDWVLESACRQGAEWAAKGIDLQIAVNFSARQVGHPDVITGIERALDVSGMDPRQLIAEVTESSVLEDTEVARTVFARISDFGATVAIDDFGTGYSSLVYLKRYKIGALKVDRQFVAGLGVSAEDDAIVASVITLARAVGAVCIAEGVETVEQYAALGQLGCEFAQGYLFARPVPSRHLPEALQACHALLMRSARGTAQECG
jgi:diguanylate cyclase (GGDEF)-like protein